MKLNYDYGTTDNNGNVKSQQITVQRSNQSPLVLTQSYVYDSLNRLKSAEEKDTANQTTWKQTYTFDRYGNRRFDQANTTFPTSFSNPNITNPTIDTANNRFTSGQGYTYDLSGNLLTDAENRSFVYDAENKQKEAKNSSNQTIGLYLYDGEGNRIKKITSTEITIFVYDASDKMVAEYSTSAPTNPQTSYLTNDHLGSPRIITNELGQTTSRRDFMPFGEEIYSAQRTTNLNYSADNIRQKFTSYERDTETDLDFAQARYFDSGFGRFSSPDDFLNDTQVVDPQSWNLYVYARNNPLKYIDPNGKEIWIVGANNTRWMYVPCDDNTSRLVDADGNEYTGGDETLDLASSYLNELRANGFRGQVEGLAGNDVQALFEFNINNSDDPGFGNISNGGSVWGIDINDEMRNESI